MLPESVTNLAFQDFELITEGKKVVILYPQVTYRNIFLSYFLKNGHRDLFYYRVPHAQKTIVDFCEHLIVDFRQSIPNFGQRMLANMAQQKPKLLGEALALDIADCVSTRPALFVLDELDRVSLSKTLRVFFAALVEHLPANIQLVINSRVATYDPWAAIVRRGDGAVLGTENRRSNMMFTNEDQPKPQLEVFAFGRGQGIVNGQPIENWDGALPRTLFFYFVDNPMVTRDQVFEAFWHNSTPKDATNVFHVTKRKISERISAKIITGEGVDLINFSNGFYIHSGMLQIHYDVAEFEDILNQADHADNDDTRLALYRTAIDLYKGPFLDTVDQPWVNQRREELKQRFIETLIGLSRILRDRGEHQESVIYFLRTLHEVPLREDIHREVMQAYIVLGKPNHARQQYQYLVDLLREQFNVSPGRETRELYESIGD